MKIRNALVTVSSVCGLFLTVQAGFAQGSLTPPGAPGPTMKTLAQVEPRTIVNAANTPGDADDSYIISQPGSYYLTSNLDGANGLNGIEITTNNVTLDLNGFAVQGASDSDDGIYIPNAQTNITVRNGSIIGWTTGVHSLNQNASDLVFERLDVSASGYNGIYIVGACVVRDCNMFDNADNGLSCGNGSVVAGCTVGYSTSGIFCGDGTVTGCTVDNNVLGLYCGAGTITGCTAENNYGGYEGIYCGNGTISGCRANNNDTGILAGSGCVVKDCVANGNSASGISAGNDVLIAGCTVAGNSGSGITTSDVCKVADCVVAGNSAYGIVTSDHAQVIGCHVNGNTSGGVKISNYSLVRDNMVDYQEGTTTTPGITATGSRNRIEGNNITRCGIGLQATANENLIIRNSVSGSTGVAYSIASGNSVGVIVVPTSSGTISGSSGGGIGSTDPTANFSY